MRELKLLEFYSSLKNKYIHVVYNLYMVKSWVSFVLWYIYGNDILKTLLKMHVMYCVL